MKLSPDSNGRVNTQGFLQILIKTVLLACLVARECRGAVNPAPSLSELARVGALSRGRLDTNAAAWTVTIASSQGEAVVKCISTTNLNRFTFGEISAGKFKTSLAVYEQGGFWYYIDADRAIKSRPYAGVYPRPGVHSLVEESRLVFYDTECASCGLAEAVYEGADESLTRYRIRIPQAQVSTIERSLQSVRANNSKHPAPGIEDYLKSFDEVVKNGAPVYIDRTNAFLQKRLFDLMRSTVTVTDFKWLEHSKVQKISLPQLEWEDQSVPLAETNWTDVIGIHSTPESKSELPTSDLGAHVMNIQSGQLRRVPYPGKACQAVGFSQAHDELLVIGVTAEGEMELAWVDLLDGDSQALSVPEFNDKALMFGAMSHSKKECTVAILAPGDSAEQIQLYRVTLETQSAKAIGPPMAYTELAYLPDDSGLVVGAIGDERNAQGLKLRFLHRLLWNGKLTPLGQGSAPVAIPGTGRILFFDGKERAWHTCDSRGEGNLRYADGMLEYRSPAISPDGKKLVWLRPTPSPADMFVFSFEKLDGRHVNERYRGFSNPVW